MTATDLLKLTQLVLKAPACTAGIPGIEGLPPPFGTRFCRQDLVDAIDGFFVANKGFTVILGYPPGMCEEPGETYSSDSLHATTWEEAALEVASEMLEENLVSTGDELTISDVFIGRASKSACPGVDRSSIIRFSAEGEPRLLDPISAHAEDVDPLLNRERQLLEGWILMNAAENDAGEPIAEIQKVDESVRFKNDDVAIDFVRKEAERGLVYHKNAIKLHDAFEADYQKQKDTAHES